MMTVVSFCNLYVLRVFLFHSQTLPTISFKSVCEPSFSKNQFSLKLSIVKVFFQSLASIFTIKTKQISSFFLSSNSQIEQRCLSIYFIQVYFSGIFISGKRDLLSIFKAISVSNSLSAISFKNCRNYNFFHKIYLKLIYFV